jgi:vitamin B12 transporter
VQIRLVFKILSATLALTLSNHWAAAQVDSSLWLQPMEVTARRIDFTNVGKHVDALDSTPIARLPHTSLASLLSAQTPLYVRSYGIGTLSTLGIRGGSASHTQLVWNGIPIRNPMIGLVDLALIPTPLIDNASIHYGGHGSAFGSGAVGGLISLANEPLNTAEHVSLHAYTGDWHTRGGSLKFNYGAGQFSFGTRVMHHVAENDFTYRLQDGLPEKTQTNHHHQNSAILQEINWNLNPHNSIIARAWWQETAREIPPTSVQTTSKSAQQDRALRSSVQWKHHGRGWNWQVKAAMLDETINFQDSLIKLYTNNHFRTWIGEFEMADRVFDFLDIAAGLYAEQVEATSANYNGTNKRNQQAAYASLRVVKNAWVFRLQGREELTDDQWSPFLVDLATEWHVLNGITWKASVSRNYRVPTLNDLLWRPGGNPDLLPEKGWTAESGFHLTSKPGQIQGNASVTGYARKINQWIMWMPPVKDVRNYWSPINVSEVDSRGLEWRADARYIHRKFSAKVNTGIDFTWSTFATDLPEFRITSGDQLFYVPVENIVAGIQLDLAGFQINYQQHWFGDSPGINEPVKAGTMSNATLAYHWSKKTTAASIYLHIDNAWDTPYRLIERRPMPGRSAQLGISLSL